MFVGNIGQDGYLGTQGVEAKLVQPMTRHLEDDVADFLRFDPAQEALQAENETLQAEKETLQAEKETLQAEKETLQEEKQAALAELARLRARLRDS